jgi:hypothetical protein
MDSDNTIPFPNNKNSISELRAERWRNSKENIELEKLDAKIIQYEISAKTEDRKIELFKLIVWLFFIFAMTALIFLFLGFIYDKDKFLTWSAALTTSHINFSWIVTTFATVCSSLGAYFFAKRKFLAKGNASS